MGNKEKLTTKRVVTTNRSYKHEDHKSAKNSKASKTEPGMTQSVQELVRRAQRGQHNPNEGLVNYDHMGKEPFPEYLREQPPLQSMDKIETLELGRMLQEHITANEKLLKEQQKTLRKRIKELEEKANIKELEEKANTSNQETSPAAMSAITETSK